MSNIFNKQIITILTIFLVILIGLIFGIAKPRSKAFIARYKELSENQTKLAAAILKKENLTKLKSNQKIIEDALKKTENILPDEKETSDFLVQLEGGSKDTGNNLKSIKFTETTKPQAAKEEGGGTEEKQSEVKPEAQTTHKTISFSINLGGNYEQFLGFIALSENLSRFVNIVSITTTNSGDNLLDTKIEGEIYYQ